MRELDFDIDEARAEAIGDCNALTANGLAKLADIDGIYKKLTVSSQTSLLLKTIHSETIN